MCAYFFFLSSSPCRCVLVSCVRDMHINRKTQCVRVVCIDTMCISQSNDWRFFTNFFFFPNSYNVYVCISIARNAKHVYLPSYFSWRDAPHRVAHAMAIYLEFTKFHLFSLGEIAYLYLANYGVEKNVELFTIGMTYVCSS